MVECKTYSAMNEEIKKLLRMTGEGMDLYVVTRIEELEQENADLRAKLETANKIIDEYQQNIIPGFRERAEKAEKERDEVWRQIEELQKENDELLAESEELVRTNYILSGKYKRH